MSKVNELFELQYGNGFDLVHLKQDENGINFISRTSKNNGVSAKVAQTPTVKPFPGGLITVALSGNPLEAFLQTSPFYTAFHIMVLTPKVSMTIEQKLFYCYCLYLNKYKYNYGRQANSTLKDLVLPNLKDIPQWVNSFSVKLYTTNLINNLQLSSGKSTVKPSNKTVPLGQLFRTVNGMASSGLKRFLNKPDDSYIPYVRPSYRQNTSIDAFVSKTTVEPKYVFPKGTLYVSTNGQGSHTFAYVSVFDFIPNSDVCVLIPKRDMSIQEKLYYAECITRNRYKFSYGRKPKGDRLKSIQLPEYPSKFIADYDINKVVEHFAKTIAKF